MNTLLTSQVYNVKLKKKIRARLFFQSTLTKVNSQQNIQARRKYCRGQNSATALRSKQEHKRCVMQPSGLLVLYQCLSSTPHPLSQPTPMPQNQMASLMFPALQIYTMHSEWKRGFLHINQYLNFFLPSTILLSLLLTWSRTSLKNH